jgi:hypothetical protein
MREGLWLWRLRRMRRLWLGRLVGLGLWLGRLLLVMGRVLILLTGLASDYADTRAS